MPSGANLALNADFSANSIGFVAPVMTGLEYFNYFGDQPGRTVRNLVVGKPTAPIVVGSPVVGAGYVSMIGGTNFVDSGVTESAAQTALVVCRWPNAVNGLNFALSTFTAPAASLASRTSSGFSLYNDVASGAGTITIKMSTGRFNGSTASTVQTQLPAGTSPAPFSLYVVRATDAYQRIQDLTRNLNVNAAQTAARDPTASRIRLGSGISGGAGGQVDLAAAAIYSRELSDAEVTAMAAPIRAYLATKGITV